MIQTYIIIGGNKEKRKEQALVLRNAQKSKPVDTVIMPKEEETAIKIDHVREVQRTISHQPLVSKTKTIIFLEMERASEETQHALLKLLEEPPPFVVLILTAAKKESLLPTVLSRATMIRLKQESELPDVHNTFNDLKKVLAENSGFKFSYGTTFETKEKAASWLQSALYGFHQTLLEDVSMKQSYGKEFFSSIRKINRALYTLQHTNTNPRLLMENLLLELSDPPVLDPSPK